ncbi:glycosyl hydrolase family 17 protein [Wenzhouxiangella sp. XN24]|uniref:glycosyl hydrolase family 17 protein n=1 Tax=Wenzhouxiangella sp. XN24 TaxID=2713569 RepID=UPI0013EC6B73|nr:glycosyl hydrolase family 17 protein [Wenzhouxiangella sp. XN24]NGX16259.1 glycosyl hydrolase [Wenzhouxiangella sp. XN24]
MRLEHGNAICYSGYRHGQSPVDQVYPSYDQVHEDLRILSRNWGFLRLYDCSPHAELVLEVIRRERLPFRLMLGLDMAAEMSNPHCPWGAEFSPETLAGNRKRNEEEVERAIQLSRRYEDIVFAVSVGNEASVEWTDHMVPVDRLVAHVRKLKSAIPHPVTFCENYVPWTYKLEPLAAELDFISVHTYPAWEYRTMEDALSYTRQNYLSVADHYPGKPVIITEAGWTTASNGRGIEPWNANEELQRDYYEQLMEWTNAAQILTFVFEAFDEPWKGSPDPLEPEKHWGLFTVERQPKLVMQGMYP